MGKSLAQPARSNPKTFRRARLWLASLIALALGALAATFVGVVPAGRSLELAVSDMLRAACSLPAENESAPVTTIEIDDAALARGGRWPWPRPQQAEFLDALVSLNPRLVALDVEYATAEEACVAWRPTADGGQEPYILFDPNSTLRASVVAAGNVLVPFSLYIAGRAEDGDSAGAAPAAEVQVPPFLECHALDLSPDEAPGLVAAEGLNPMLPGLAEVCAGSGYTSVVKDVDGSLRRVPLMVRAGDRVFPHLALEMAGQWRFGPDYCVRLDGGRLVISSADGGERVSVPVDAAARLNLRWPSSLSAMRRIAAGPVLDLVHARRELEAHRRRLDRVREELGVLFPGVADPTTVLLDYQGRAAQPETDDLEIRRAKAAASFLPFLAAYDDQEKELAAGVERAATRLRPHVEGRLCVVGLNATAVSDQHRTPISRIQPGVTVYPAAMQTILSGVAFTRLSVWSEWLIAVLFAWVVAGATARLPTGWGIAATVALSCLLAAVAWSVSASVALLLPLAGPVLAVLVAFAGVSAYRQLTEASSRRWIARAFQQYLSAELLDEIQRDPESLRLGGERREITFLFSDVAGFTSLSERLEPEPLVALLNRYLSAMTDTILAEGAKLDKYEGDGILALFGAPVRTEDHALRAVRAALAMQEALPRVNRELVDLGLLPEGRRLAMRVGLSSGPAIVGNFGSEQRFDYTAMGDTVNVGGRLEEANRWLGSHILVPEATRQACGDAVLFRRFGPARIRGKSEPIVLYEPLALEPASPEVKAVAGAFGRAVDALAAGDFSAADAAIGEVLAADPQDGPAQILRERIEAARAGRIAPDEPWNLARAK
ncbi:MAG TPA: adenylate/guanylate cyclase domain-containing protein [Phycisphaerae bacterium]|nr:adenylate/guanylate cyclase domain-containing protein [Phycisphaerae bacterium]